jgi:hypothetical protein
MTDASQAIARLRELRAKATAGPWATRRHLLHDHERWGPLVEIGQRQEQIGDCILGSVVVFGSDEEWVGDSPILQAITSDSDDNAAAIVAAMNSLDALLECASVLQVLATTASRYRELVDNDAGHGLTGPAFTSLYNAENKARASLQALAEGGGE